MSDRIFNVERPGEESLSTATLAGLETPSAERDPQPELREIDSENLGSMDLRDDPAVHRNETLRDEAAAFREEPAVGTADLLKRGHVGSSAAPGNRMEEQTTPLFPSGEATEMRSRWDTIQVGFVDEPRHAVEQADALVAGAMKRLAEIFAEERARLEGQWDRGDNVSTEDLRLALRRYRSFFGRVLSV